MVVADLLPMIITRSPEFSFLDTDQFVRAVCEAMVINNPQGQLLKLIFDQGWFTSRENQFSQELVDQVCAIFYPYAFNNKRFRSKKDIILYINEINHQAKIDCQNWQEILKEPITILQATLDQAFARAEPRLESYW